MMSRQMLSACTGSFKSRYLSARSSAAGTASPDNFFNSNSMSVPLKEHLENTGLCGAAKSAAGVSQWHAFRNHIKDVYTPRFEKSQGRLKPAAARPHQRNLI